MIKLLMMSGLVFLVSSCTIQLNIDTDYASQNESDGEIQEKVTTKSDATTTPTVDTSIELPEAGL